VLANDGRLTGVAPAAKVLPIKFIPSKAADPHVDDFHGGGVLRILDPYMIDAAEYAKQQRANVISMSCGGVMLDEFKRKLDELVLDDGVIAVAAAGQTYALNAATGLADAIHLLGLETDDSVVEPANFSNVIAVAGCTTSLHPWMESHRGPNVDITAPADGVWVADLSSNQTRRGSTTLRAETLECASGTSFATAIVAGVAALWLGHHGVVDLRARYVKSPIAWVFRALLQQTARRGPSGAWDTARFGPGIVDAEALLAAPLPPDGMVPAPPATLRNMFTDLADILEAGGDQAAALLAIIEDGARHPGAILDDARDGAAVLMGGLITLGREAGQHLLQDWNSLAASTEAWVRAGIADASHLAEQLADAAGEAEETAAQAGIDAVDAAGDFIVSAAKEIGEAATDLVDWVFSW
jgi:subtilisin family serine protease